MKAVDLGLSVYWGESLLEIPNKHFEEHLFTWGDDLYNSAHSKAHEEDDFEELANSGIITDDGFLTPQYDHAYQILGDKWRMPTVDEFKELIDKCKWTWVDNGYAITGTNKNSIKLPYIYHSFRNTISGVIADTGGYWSSEPSFEEYGDALYFTAYALNFSNPEYNHHIDISTNKRNKKNLIIPVTVDASLLKENDSTPIRPQRPSFIAPDAWIDDYSDTRPMNIVPPPIVPNGEKFPLPFWNKLSNKAKDFLDKQWGVKCENEYNKLLNDMEEVYILEHALKNYGLI